jgi:hypothetical protein
MERKWEGLCVLVGQAVSKRQFCILKIPNVPKKLHLVPILHSSEHPA